MTSVLQEQILLYHINWFGSKYKDAICTFYNIWTSCWSKYCSIYSTQFTDPIHQTSSYHLLLIWGTWPWNDCNSVISDLQVLKLHPAVALWFLFLTQQVRSEFDSPRNSYAQSPKMTWLNNCLSRVNLYNMPHVTVSTFGSEKDTQKTIVRPLSITSYEISI